MESGNYYSPTVVKCYLRMVLLTQISLQAHWNCGLWTRILLWWNGDRVLFSSKPVVQNSLHRPKATPSFLTSAKKAGFGLGYRTSLAGQPLLVQRARKSVLNEVTSICFQVEHMTYQ